MSTAGNNYEAWKESMMDADANGVEVWSDDGEPVTPKTLLSSIIQTKEAFTGLLLGAGLMLIGVIILAPNFKHLAQGKRTVGIVVDYKDYINRRSNALVAPIVRYSAPGGVYDFVGCLSLSRTFYPQGKEVTVLYLPNNSGNAVICDFASMFMIPTVVSGLGLAILIGTAGCMYMVIRIELPPDTAPAFAAAPKHFQEATSTPQKKEPAAAPQTPEPAACGTEDASD